MRYFRIIPHANKLWPGGYNPRTAGRPDCIGPDCAGRNHYTRPDGFLPQDFVDGSIMSQNVFYLII